MIKLKEEESRRGEAQSRSRSSRRQEEEDSEEGEGFLKALHFVLVQLGRRRQVRSEEELRITDMFFY